MLRSKINAFFYYPVEIEVSLINVYTSRRLLIFNRVFPLVEASQRQVFQSKTFHKKRDESTLKQLRGRVREMMRVNNFETIVLQVLGYTWHTEERLCVTKNR